MLECRRIGLYVEQNKERVLDGMRRKKKFKEKKWVKLLEELSR